MIAILGLLAPIFSFLAPIAVALINQYVASKAASAAEKAAFYGFVAAWEANGNDSVTLGQSARAQVEQLKKDLADMGIQPAPPAKPPGGPA